MGNQFDFMNFLQYPKRMSRKNEVKRDYVGEVLKSNEIEVKQLLATYGIANCDDRSFESNVRKMCQDKEFFVKVLYLHPDRTLYERVTKDVESLNKPVTVIISDKPLEIKEQGETAPKEHKAPEKPKEQTQTEGKWRKHLNCSEDHLIVSWTAFIPTAITLFFLVGIMFMRKS